MGRWRRFAAQADAGRDGRPGYASRRCPARDVRHRRLAKAAVARPALAWDRAVCQAFAKPWRRILVRRRGTRTLHPLRRQDLNLVRLPIFATLRKLLSAPVLQLCVVKIAPHEPRLDALHPSSLRLLRLMAGRARRLSGLAPINLSIEGAQARHARARAPGDGPGPARRPGVHPPRARRACGKSSRNGWPSATAFPRDPKRRFCRCWARASALCLRPGHHRSDRRRHR